MEKASNRHRGGMKHHPEGCRNEKKKRARRTDTEPLPNVIGKEKGEVGDSGAVRGSCRKAPQPVPVNKQGRKGGKTRKRAPFSDKNEVVPSVLGAKGGEKIRFPCRSAKIKEGLLHMYRGEGSRPPDSEERLGLIREGKRCPCSKKRKSVETATRLAPNS